MIPRSGKIKPAIIAAPPDKSTICTVGITMIFNKMPKADHSEKKAKIQAVWQLRR